MRYSREEACLAWLTYGNLAYQDLARLLDDFGSAELFYDNFSEDPKIILSYGPRTCMSALLEHGTRDAMHEMLITMQKHDMRIMRLGDYCYPKLLKEISDPPLILFYQGDPYCLREKCITMVGSRSASMDGRRTAHDIAAEFGRRNITVVSGFAQGIDRASHEGCLDGGGRTVAVLACGLDVDYPSGSQALRKRIMAQEGILLSEFPPGSPAIPWHFPVRNRIMSGISTATLMMECQPKSGSMLTVQHALDQGREVFAHPGKAGAPATSGAHTLLREGANYFVYAEDVLNDLGWSCEKRIAPPAPVFEAPPQPLVSDEQQKILDVLKEGECSFDQLAAATGFNAPTLSSTLTMLQLLGLIKAMPGKTYARV